MMRRSVEGKNGKKLAVSSITGMYVGKDGTTYYQVQWSPSWESQDNIIGCEKLIQEFHVRQEKEIFGGTVAGTQASGDQLDEIKASVSNEISDLRNSINTKLSDMEGLLGDQQSCNEEFSRRLGALEESSYHTTYYYDRVRRQNNSAPETDMGCVQSEDIASRDKDDESNELYFEDMLYNEYIEDNMEPRRKRNRGDIAVGIPVAVDGSLATKIKERLESANCLAKEAEVLHAVRVCNVRHILALKLAQIIFSNEELAGASYAPGNFNPLDSVKLSLIEDISFMRFKTDETEVKEVSWGQIHQRIKNKCRCKRKEYNDKLSNSSALGSFKISSVFSGNTSCREKTSSVVNYKNTMAYSMASARSKYDKFPNSFGYQTSSYDSTTVNSPGVLDMTNTDVTTQSTGTNPENVPSSSNLASVSQTSSDSNENNSTDIAIICKEDESDYTDDS